MSRKHNFASQQSQATQDTEKSPKTYSDLGCFKVQALNEPHDLAQSAQTMCRTCDVGEYSNNKAT